MTYSQFTDDLRTEFYKALESKTNWGREQIKMQFEQAVLKCCLSVMEKLTCNKSQ